MGSGGRRARWWWCAATAVLVIALTPARPAAAEESGGLLGLRRVGLVVDLVHPLEPLSEEDLRARLEDALRESDPPLSIQTSATDQIRLTVSVGPVSATTLRGFWLPFSGTYGIGILRLGIERMVALPGTRNAFPALVWFTERTVARPWRGIAAETVRLLDEMVAEFQEARFRAR